MDRRQKPSSLDISRAKYSYVINSEEQNQRAARDEKEGLISQLHARVSEETDSTLLEHVDLSDDLRERSSGGIVIDGGDGSNSRRRRRRQLSVRLGPVWLWAMHAGLFMLSLMFFSLSITLSPSTVDFVQRFSAYSPALSAVEYETVTFNNTKGAAKTAYVGAGPEADKAWEHITRHMGDQMVDEADMVALGKPREGRLRVTDEATGASGWRMELAVVHQLHCLNLVRRFVHKDYYQQSLDNRDDLAVPEEHLKGHLDHCIEALRMKIMCEADVGVILYKENSDHDGKMEPDYETQHVCRNWERVREWAITNKVANKETF